MSTPFRELHPLSKLTFILTLLAAAILVAALLGAGVGTAIWIWRQALEMANL